MKLLIQSNFLYCLERHRARDEGIYEFLLELYHA
jgi:hypothetical protein